MEIWLCHCSYQKQVLSYSTSEINCPFDYPLSKISNFIRENGPFRAYHLIDRKIAKDNEPANQINHHQVIEAMVKFQNGKNGEDSNYSLDNQKIRSQ